MWEGENVFRAFLRDRERNLTFPWTCEQKEAISMVIMLEVNISSKVPRVVRTSEVPSCRLALGRSNSKKGWDSL